MGMDQSSCMNWVVTAVITFQMLGKLAATCTVSTAEAYVTINETHYDRVYSSLDSGHHPLGFYAGQWSESQGNAGSPCVKITAPSNSLPNLEVMFETIPEARLCVKLASLAEQCFQGRGRVCHIAPAVTTAVQFMCDNQCLSQESDVNFWYRLVLMPPGGDTDTWCSNNRTNQYPKDLIELPPGVTFPTYTTPKPRGTGLAPLTVPSTSALVVALTMSLLCVIGV